jgi:hypothetical protein
MIMAQQTASATTDLVSLAERPTPGGFGQFELIALLDRGAQRGGGWSVRETEPLAVAVLSESR